jgi:hypothetical protein
MQGVANNAQGLGAELDVAESAPGVAAVSRRFWAAPLQRAAGNGHHLRFAHQTVTAQQSPTAPHAGADDSAASPMTDAEQALRTTPGAATASCEVDVVAQQGHAWVEVKSHGMFGVHSTHWLGSAGHTKGEVSDLVCVRPSGQSRRPPS